MSNISAVSNASNEYLAPNLFETASATSTSFSQLLTANQGPKSLLCLPESSLANRPDIKGFMDRTGSDFMDASELIYGVVGSNTDVRDWAAIMASDDPISAARQATGQMYGRTDISPRTDATYAQDIDTVAKEGNFVIRQLKDESGSVVDQGLKLTDAQGLLLRDAGNSPQTIARNAWLFGFDTQPLAKLVDAASTISKDLGSAILQASTSKPLADTSVAISQVPVATMAIENTHLIGLADMQLPSNAASVIASVNSAQSAGETTSPALELAIQEATKNATAFVDSATYLSGLLQA